jgi:hypothetical protein
MTLADTIGRRITARRPDFASIKTAFAKQKHDLRRAKRRWTSLLPAKLRRQSPAGALQAGIEPLRLLQEILDHADLIALDVREPGHTGNVHMLVTLPTWLLERATVIAAYDTDDEDTDGGEDDQDKEMGGDDEYSLGRTENINQERAVAQISVIDPGGGWFTSDGEDLEASLGSLDGQVDQRHWADGGRLDRECDPCDLGELDHDNEPDERDWPMHGDAEASELTREISWRRAAEPLPPDPEDGPAQVWEPTGTRPDGGIEMENLTTGQRVVGHLILTEDLR